MEDKRLVIVAGHYGSGKTEFSVNYALNCRDVYEHVSLADLDIINPYFRSRERKRLLEERGIHVIGSSIDNTTLEIPALSAEIYGLIQNKSIKAILDVGGDPAGARVISRFSEQIKRNEYTMLYVINGNRPDTDSKEKIIRYMKDIEKTSGLKVSGLINNTHMLKNTTVSDVERGHELSKAVFLETNIPIRYEVCIKEVAEKVKNEEIKEKIFPINLYMREDWMS